MGALLSNALSALDVAEDGEEFLSLEDTTAPKVEVKKRKSPYSYFEESQTTNQSFVEDKTNTLDMMILGEYGGKQSICWPIQDMDCPHCASEAMNALNRLEHVNSSLVVLRDGTVTIDVDFEKGNISEASSVLKSLGNPPDIPFMQISGVNSSAIAQRNSVTVKVLPRIFRRQPGVLDCDIDREGNLKLQTVPNLNNEMQLILDESLKKIIGGEYKLIPEKINTVTAGQWRMIGSGIAFISLVILLLVESLVTDNPWVIGGIGFVGVALGGIKMFSKAFHRLKIVSSDSKY